MAAKKAALGASYTQAAPSHEKPLRNSNRDACFVGNFTRRQSKAVAALLARPTSREALDVATGASNSPALVLKLRRKGFEIPCARVRVIDDFGQPCWPGIYSLSTDDRAKLNILKGSHAE